MFQGVLTRFPLLGILRKRSLVLFIDGKKMAVKSLRGPRIDNRSPVVLDAAARIFAEHGYSGSSIREIAEACDMQPGSLYYHFAAKEDLLVAVYERGVEEIQAAVVEAVQRET
ncbi:MAG: helix-turn-helix transcriptional regulator, partial [Betaproteobacteria bacterium]|nr:helix-turn-helix transcriptional regulator [Betaproteobacteria bacterium]